MFAACLVLLVSTSSRPAANFPPPEWAYPATPRGFTPDPDDGNPKHLAGSTRAAIDYFVKLPRKPWIAVIEAEMAPFVACVPMGAVKRGQALVEGMRLTAISRRRRWPVDRPPTSCGSSTTCRAALAPAERRS